jgi:NAD(P)-dependent dehydrogenase (short-subunit alcohol dehydrogenase family)
VLVTGGTRGVGRGVVAAFAHTGATVVACARKQPEAFPHPFVACDVRDADAASAMVQQVAAEQGRLDVVVNNAGGGPYAPATTMSPKFFDRIVALNLLAPFYVAQAANAVMQGQDDGGLIVNVGSIVSRRPCPGTAPYNAAKAGLVVLTRSLALEWAPKVRVNCVTAGLVRTEAVHQVYGTDIAGVEATVPLGRLADPIDVGRTCLLLASPLASYVTGAELVADGGGEEPSFLQAVVIEQ